MYLPDVHGDHLIRHTLVVPVLSIEYVVDEEQTEFFFTDFEVVQDDPVLVPFAQWSDFGYLWFLRSRRWFRAAKPTEGLTTLVRALSSSCRGSRSKPAAPRPHS